MRSFEVRRTVAVLPLLALALGLLFAPPLLAADDGGFECTLESFKGSYIFTRNGTWVAKDGQRHPTTYVGVVRPDGQGRIPYLAQTVKSASRRRTDDGVLDDAAGTVTGFGFEWGDEPQEFQRAIGGRWEYSMEPSCRGVITFTRDDGRVPASWRMILTNGGRDGVLASIGSGSGLWMGTLRRIDSADQELEDRVARMEELLGNMARVLGIVPKRD